MNAPQTTRRKVLIREREDLSPPGRRAWLPAGVLEYKLLESACSRCDPVDPHAVAAEPLLQSRRRTRATHAVVLLSCKGGDVTVLDPALLEMSVFFFVFIRKFRDAKEKRRRRSQKIPLVTATPHQTTYKLS